MKIIFVIILLTSNILLAQQEFIVNSHLPLAQRDVHCARDAQGNYVVVWQSLNQVAESSAADIYLQRFNSDGQKNGAELCVNDSTTGEQIKPALTMNSKGNFITAWQSYSDFNSIYDIKAKLFKNGLAAGSEFLVNSTTNHSQVNPEVTINNSGEFVIVWESWFQDGSNKGIYAQRFDSSGTPAGPEFAVNTTTQNSQARPSVKYFPDGRFLVIWESWAQEGTAQKGYGLYGQLFSNSGEKLGNEFQLNTFTNDFQWYGDLEVISNDEFVAVWCSWGQDGDFGGVYLQRFNSDGTKIDGEILVNRQTAWYQWLPKIKKLATGNLAVIWSSFRQDGSREGVYGRLFSPAGKALTLETRINDYTHSYQWEPDFITGQGNEITAFWSSWGQYGNDYEVIGKTFSFTIPDGQLDPQGFEHTGKSDAHIKVHVIDSSLVTGHQYEISFKTYNNDSITSSIKDINTASTLIENFSLSRGKNYFYLTPVFDGVAVEYLPEYKLSLDINKSYFKNVHGTNLQFETNYPAAGTLNLASIDIELRWGNTDTLGNGLYTDPSDTAIGINGVRDIVVPFKAWNITDDGPVSLLILEQGTKNKRWDPGESIIFLTPQPYKQSASDTHAQINIVTSDSSITMPGPGDINYIFTVKPITDDDKFYFNTSLDNLTGLRNEELQGPVKFELYQNYPNPFNAITSIRYFVPERGKIKLEVYNTLGQQVKVLYNNIHEPGRYRLVFDASRLASGLYFYRLSFNNNAITKKMILVK